MVWFGGRDEVHRYIGTGPPQRHGRCGRAGSYLVNVVYRYLGTAQTIIAASVFSSTRCCPFPDAGTVVFTCHGPICPIPRYLCAVCTRYGRE